MEKWIVVWMSAEKSLLCKRYGNHYEVEAEGQAPALKAVADKLNGAE